MERKFLIRYLIFMLTLSSFLGAALYFSRNAEQPRDAVLVSQMAGGQTNRAE